VKLFGVRQMMPAFEVASAAARSEFQRAPLSMSAEDSQGLKALTIMGKYSLSASATARLRGPDQLMKMSMSKIVVVRRDSLPAI